jgi:hypothetical protein
MFLGAGCTRDEDYYDGVRAQRAAWKEVTDVLVTIKDETSMAAAKDALDEKARKCEEIAKKNRALPRPSAEVQARMREDSFLMEGVLKGLQRETKRVAELPGGKEFLKQFESASPGLFSAVQR